MKFGRKPGMREGDEEVAAGGDADIRSALEQAKGSRAKGPPRKSPKRGYLDGQMLIAMPSMGDERFSRSVIYVCAHSTEGAMGIVVNQPAANISFPDLLVQLDVIPAADVIQLPTAGVADMTALYDSIKRGDHGDVVQCTWGHDSNDINIPVNWNLSPFDSAVLKVVIIDSLTGTWGFVSVSRMALDRLPEPLSAKTWQLY